ncbi:hypothetical protein L596_019429 [Steinernema carpocapsae]|uniref:Uncharacterized protein n=1 Tax=Steinernema carpocapsae TaxID=34508 RepID=A0A4U5MQH8_STECR|nr:hypothetical protein L596_019429 [Steinernema carpocapsae]
MSKGSCKRLRQHIRWLLLEFYMEGLFLNQLFLATNAICILQFRRNWLFIKIATTLTRWHGNRENSILVKRQFHYLGGLVTCS